MKRCAMALTLFSVLLLNVVCAHAEYDPALGKYAGPQSLGAEMDTPGETAKVAAMPEDGAVTLYGVDVSADELLSIDKSTGVPTLIGAVGSPVVAGLAYDPESGMLYGTDTQTGNLVTVDPADGSTAVIGNTGIYLPHGLAIDPADGTLYATCNTSNLYTINKATGAATLLGPVGYPHISALDFDPTTGTLYGAYAYSDETGYLITIDTVTGLGTFVAGTHRINGMAFDENGSLFASENGLRSGVDSSLYAVNKVTGQWNVIGVIAGADNVLGLDFTLLSASSLSLSPPSGSYVTTQSFDLTLIVEAPGLSVTGGSAMLDGSDVTSALSGCVMPGTLLSGGQTFRCPGIAGRFLGAGSHTLNITLDLSNGSSVNESVSWEVLENTEP